MVRGDDRNGGEDRMSVDGRVGGLDSGEGKGGRVRKMLDTDETTRDERERKRRRVEMVLDLVKENVSTSRLDPSCSTVANRSTCRLSLSILSHRRLPTLYNRHPQ